MLLANVYITMEDHDMAIGHLEKALQMKSTKSNSKISDIAQIHHLLGSCFFKKGDYRSSIKNYSDSLQFKLDSFGAETMDVAYIMKDIGEVQRITGDTTSAIENLQKALNIFISELSERESIVAEILFDLGQCYAANNDFTKALQTLSKSSKVLQSIADDKSNLWKDVFMQKATIYVCTRQYTEALNLYNDILSQSAVQSAVKENGKEDEFNYHPLDIAEVYFRRGSTYLNLKMFRQAFNDFCTCSSIYKNNISTSKKLQVGSNNMSRETYLCVLEKSFDLTQERVIVGKDVQGNLCNNIGDAYVLSSNYVTAIIWYKKAYEFQVETDQDDVIRSATLHNIGNCLFDVGDLTNSERYHEKALALTKRTLGNNHIDLADTFFSLAVTNQLNSNFDKSMTMYESALKIRVKTLGFECVEVGLTLRGLASLFECKGDFYQSSKTCEEALRILKANHMEDSPHGVSLQLCLGKNYRSVGEIEKSLQHLHSAMEIIHRISSDDHLETGKILFELGVSHEVRNEFSRSRSYLEQSLDNLCAFLGFQRSDIHFYEESAADLVKTDQKFKSEFMQKLSIFASGGNGILNSDTVMLFGKILERNEYYKTALLCFEYSSNVFSVSLQPRSVRLSESLHCQGKVLLVLEQFDRSEDVLKDALSIRKEKLGESHIDVELTSSILGHALMKNNKNSEALDLLNFCIFARKKRLIKYDLKREEEHETELRIGKIYHEESKYDMAIVHYERSLRVARKLYSERDEKFGDIYFHLGNLFSDMGQDGSALNYFQKAIDVFTHNKTCYRKLSKSLLNMGDLHFENNCFEQAIVYYDR